MLNRRMFLAAGLFAFACALGSGNAFAEEKVAKSQDVTYDLSGMTCPVNSPPAVVAAFKKDSAVSEVKVNYKKKTAKVTFNPKKTDEKKLVAVLKKTPFKATLPKKEDAKKTEGDAKKKEG